MSALQDILQLIASARERLEEEKRLQEDKEAECTRAKQELKEDRLRKKKEKEEKEKMDMIASARERRK